MLYAFSLLETSHPYPPPRTSPKAVRLLFLFSLRSLAFTAATGVCVCGVFIYVCTVWWSAFRGRRERERERNLLPRAVVKQRGDAVEWKREVGFGGGLARGEYVRREYRGGGAQRCCRREGIGRRHPSLLHLLLLLLRQTSSWPPPPRAAAIVCFESPGRSVCRVCAVCDARRSAYKNHLSLSRHFFCTLPPSPRDARRSPSARSLARARVCVIRCACVRVCVCVYTKKKTRGKKMC